MVRAARVDPGLGAHLEVRARGPEDGAGGQHRHGLLDLLAVDVLDDQAEAVAQVDEGGGDGRAGLGGEDQARGVLAVAHGERRGADGDLALGHGRVDLGHVGLEDAVLARDQVVGVVLHERGALGGRVAGGHDLHEAHHRGCLPVALGAKAVALLHEALNRERRQLLEAAEVAEVVGEGVVVVLHEEALDADLLGGLDLDMGAELLRVTAVEHQIVGVVVLVGEGLDLGVGDAVDVGHELVDGPGVHGPAKDLLGLDLVAVGHRDVAHGVREAAHADVTGLVDAHRHALPGTELGQDGLVLPVAEDDLVVPAHAGEDVPELALAMGRLVLVHEVHVDGVVRNLLVVLRRELAQRLAEVAQAGDVVLGRGEGVRPSDDAGALGIHVGLVERGLDDVGREQVGLEHDLEGHLVGRVERGDDLGGVLGDVLEHLVAVEVLGAGAEIEAVLLDLEHVRSFRHETEQRGMTCASGLCVGPSPLRGPAPQARGAGREEGKDSFPRGRDSVTPFASCARGRCSG